MASEPKLKTWSTDEDGLAGFSASINMTDQQLCSIYVLLSKFHGQPSITQTWTKSGGVHTYVKIKRRKKERVWHVAKNGNAVELDKWDLDAVLTTQGGEHE